MSVPTMLSTLLSARAEGMGLDVAALHRRLAECGAEVSAEAVRCWLAGRYAPGARYYPALATALQVEQERIALAAAGIAFDAPASKGDAAGQVAS